MKKSIIIWIIIVILLILGVVWYANKNQTISSPAPEVIQQNIPQETNPTTNNTSRQTVQTTTTAQTIQKNIVTIENLAFSPSTITVKAGSTVTWINNDPMSHTITGDTSGPKSSALSNKQSYSYTFKTPGTYSYHCSIHPSMKGTVIVQ